MYRIDVTIDTVVDAMSTRGWVKVFIVLFMIAMNEVGIICVLMIR